MILLRVMKGCILLTGVAVPLPFPVLAEEGPPLVALMEGKIDVGVRHSIAGVPEPDHVLRPSDRRVVDEATVTGLDDLNLGRRMVMVDRVSVSDIE